MEIAFINYVLCLDHPRLIRAHEEPSIPPSLLAAARRVELVKKLTAAGVIGVNEASQVKDLYPTVVNELRIASRLDDPPSAPHPEPLSTPNPAKCKNDDLTPADSLPFSPEPQRPRMVPEPPIRLGAELNDELAADNAALRDQCVDA